MAIYITARHMVGGSGHQHIASVRWRQTDDASKTGENTRDQMVDWIKNKGGVAYVTDGTNTVAVGVRDANPPYLQTYADKVWTDNLLALSTY
jgi:hypothetical protein